MLPGLGNADLGKTNALQQRKEFSLSELCRTQQHAFNCMTQTYCRGSQSAMECTQLREKDPPLSFLPWLAYLNISL